MTPNARNPERIPVRLNRDALGDGQYGGGFNPKKALKAVDARKKKSEAAPKRQ